MGGHDVNSRPIGKQPEKEREEEEEEEEDEVKVQEENLLLNHVQQVRKKKSLKDCEQIFLLFSQSSFNCCCRFLRKDGYGYTRAH